MLRNKAICIIVNLPDNWWTATVSKVKSTCCATIRSIPMRSLFIWVWFVPSRRGSVQCDRVQAILVLLWPSPHAIRRDAGLQHKALGPLGVLTASAPPRF